jgi:hypothetical protein
MKNTGMGMRALICGAALMMGAVEATVLVLPVTTPNSVEGSHQFSSPKSYAGVKDERRASGSLRQYSVYSQNEHTVQRLHSVLEQSMADTGYHHGWERKLEGQRIESWYNPAADQTVMSVQWSTEKGYVQATYRVQGQVRAGEMVGSGGLGEMSPMNTLEDEVERLNFKPAPENAADPEVAFQEAQQHLVSVLLNRGFRKAWFRQDPDASGPVDYVAWYHPDLDMTVLCIDRLTGSGHTQTVMPMSGKLRSNDFLPRE